MSKIAYRRQRFDAWKMQMIGQANTIIAQFAAEGYKPTLRQVYYKFVARDLFPDTWKMSVKNGKLVPDANGSTNNMRSYKKLGEIISDGRMCGYIDWDSIDDITRGSRRNMHYDSPADMIARETSTYMIDLWEGQEFLPRVYVEKDAMKNVVAKTCGKLDIPYMSCRGYTSQSCMWEEAQVLLWQIKSGITPVILHLGDLDPSGDDMSRDIRDRIEEFLAHHGFSDAFKFHRLALTPDQVALYDPPPNPAKTTDSRFKKFIEKYGEDSWELDALEPKVIDTLISERVAEYRDDELFADRVGLWREQKNQLLGVSDKWEQVVKYVEKLKRK